MASSVDRELETLIRARYPLVYIVSWEEKRVEDALRNIARERNKKLHVWTVTQGFSTASGQRDNTTRDPLAALDYVLRAPDQTIFLLKDFHAFIGDFNVTRRLRDLTLALKNSFKNLLILAPVLKLPADLEKEITVLDYGLPSYEDLGRLLDDIIRSVRDTPGVDVDLTPEEREHVLKAAQGLTAMEAENVFAKSLVEKRTFDVDVVLTEKEQIIRKSGILEYYPMNERFADVGGLNLLKEWMEKRTASFTDKAREFGLPEPKGILLLGVQGCGKCFQHNTPVLMFDGSVKAVQDVVVGDMLMGPDSRPRRVLSTTRGHGAMYRVTPTKGMPYVVNADHILTLRMSGKHKAYRQANKDGIINITVRDYLTQSACFKQRMMGYRTGVEFPARPVPLDPYFLGVWLGDGSEKVPAMTTADEAIVRHVTETAAQHGLRVRRAEKSGRPNRAATYFLTAGNQGRTVNPVLDALRDLGVLGDKHIPLLYKANSRQVRLQVLAGIVDTDGSMAGHDYDVIQRRKRLADDIAFLARSLGLAAYVYPCRKSCTVRGVRVTGAYYRVHVSGDTDMIPVRLHQKQALPRKQRKDVLNTGLRVEPVGQGDYYGFTVDGDHRFLLGDFTVVHNSLSAKAIGALWRLPLLRLDIGKVFAGLVGASEENMRKAIRVAESVAPCVAGDTRIVLADGSERTIESLYEGHEQEIHVLSMTEDGQITPVQVRAITRRPAPDLYTIQLQHSHLQATGNHRHPILRDGELRWIRTDQLRVGDHVAMPRQIPTTTEMPALIEFLPPATRLYSKGALAFARRDVQTPQRRYVARARSADYVKVEELADSRDYPAFTDVERFVLGHGGTGDSVLTRLPAQIDEEIGYLLGLIASDGYLGKQRRIGFINTDLVLHRFFADVLRRRFGAQSTTRLNTGENKNARLRGTNEQSVFRPFYVTYTDSRLLNQVLRNIQAELLRMPCDFLNAWVRGYFDGDGHISNGEATSPKITLTSKRPEMNRLVRSVLHRVGFPTTNPGSANIEITGTQNVRRFIAQIGSRHPCRRERMDAWMRKPLPVEERDRTDAIPIGRRLRRVRQALGIGSQCFQRTSASLFHAYETGQIHPSRTRLRSILAEMRAWAQARGADTAGLESIQALVDSPIGWSRVLSVEAAETPEHVYDLACAGPHNFIGNGIFSHNCVLWLDELEKGLSGMQSSGSTDGGTTARVFSTFLTWLQEKTVPVFVVATANQVEALPPELLRKGRFDEIFFIDLPSREERAEIFGIHLRKRKRDPAKFDLDALAEATPGFSGAEIEQLVIEALYDAFDKERDLTMDDLLHAASATVPLSMTMREKIAHLRDWAETRARKASSAEPESIEDQTSAFLHARAQALNRDRQKQTSTEKRPRTRRTAQKEKERTDT